MISVSQLSVQFGGSYLFQEVSFLINPTEKVGLTGRNGAGKSTLLKMLAGVVQPDGGSISIPKDTTIGYLPQEMKFNTGNTVQEEAELAFDEHLQLQNKADYLANQLVIREDYETQDYLDLITQLNDINDHLAILDVNQIKSKTEQILKGLGFTQADFSRQTSEFSGGWRMRIELAKILLRSPKIILLDEPTNHLDIDSIQWLESFLKSFQGAVILISHDRTFLDALTNRTIEISLGKIYDYKANYSKYLILRQERKTQIESEAKNQQKYIEQTQKLIDQYRYKASKAAFAQGLIKKLERLDVIEVEDEDNASIHFRFPPSPHSGKVVVELANVSKTYEPKVILNNIELLVERGEKLAFVGKNGEGKSTLLKIITEKIDFEGTVSLGHQVAIGYFAQNQSDLLDQNATVLETLEKVATSESFKKVRNILGSFLFSGDDVEKRVKVLSGGEKNRLAFAQLLLKPYNVLILDEPTNHLDIRSKEILKSALINFDGTVIVVSHDRDFLNGLTTKIYEVTNSKLKLHLGDINEYLKTKNTDSMLVASASKKGETTGDVKNKNVDYETRQATEKEQRRLSNSLKKTEDEIAQYEQKIKTMDQQLLESNFDAAGSINFFKEYDSVKRKVSDLYLSWEDISLQIEQLKNN